MQTPYDKLLTCVHWWPEEARIPAEAENSPSPPQRKKRTDMESRFVANNRERLPVIVTLYYGLQGERPYTMEAIGQCFGLTRERIRQLLEKANFFYSDEDLDRFEMQRKAYFAQTKPIRLSIIIRHAIASNTFEPTRSWLENHTSVLPHTVSNDPISILTWVHETCQISTFPDHQWCPDCRQIKSKEEFTKGSSRRCATCNRANTRQWYKTHKEQAIQARRQHYENNKDKYRQYAKNAHSRLTPEQREKKRIEMKGYYRKRKAEHPEILRAQWKRAQERRKERKRMMEEQAK